ncbi:MAG: glycosyltransferase family 39 protein [Chloroflexi bacterium]|nr:glycosyltransferase family 39 protein [Chloroflexota bacterium]
MRALLIPEGAGYPTARPGRLRAALLDLVVLGAALGIAAGARWPSLWLIPTFTDETIEVQLAYQIYHGQAAPLTNVDPYIGALWNYLLAFGFWLFGLSPWLPRLLAFIGGVTTVGAAWWLGRVLGGRVGSMVAALFVAGCSTHILVNSHVAWSNAITPLWTTLGFASLALVLYGSAPDRADPRATSGDPRYLTPAGLFLGLGVQTHITAALLLPGVVLAVLVARPSLLRSRWMAFGALAFLLATANLLAYNLQTGGQTLWGGQDVLSDYTGQDEGADPGAYVENLGRLVLATSWVLSGAIEKRRFVGETFAHPLLLAYLGLAVGSLLWTARRGRWLSLLVTLTYALALPALIPKFEPILNGRYMMPVLPLVFAAIGLATADAWTALQRRRPRGTAGAQGQSLVSAVLLAGVVLAALYPLAPLVAYERSARTNHAIVAAYEAVLAHREPSETVVLDYGLDGIFFMAAGSAYKSMLLLLGGSDVPYTVIDARTASVEEALTGHPSRLVVLNSDKAGRLGRDFTLTPLFGAEKDGPGFAVYRVSAR